MFFLIFQFNLSDIKPYTNFVLYNLMHFWFNESDLKVFISANPKLQKFPNSPGLYRENSTLKDVQIFAPQDFSPFLEKNYPNPPG